jgi:hypothetical protein
LCSPCSRKKERRPWLILHKVTEGKYTWSNIALEKIQVKKFEIYFGIQFIGQLPVCLWYTYIKTLRSDLDVHHN